MKHFPVILAAAALVACSQAPGATQAGGRPSVAAPAQPIEQDAAREQLAAFQLQTACAREARAWFNERQRNTGNPTPGWQGFTSVLILGETHYSLARHACYAVVDEQTTVSGGHTFVFADSHQLYQVDGDSDPMAEISGATRNPDDALIAGAVLGRDVKSCTVVGQKCDGLATWQAWTRPYLAD